MPSFDYTDPVKGKLLKGKFGDFLGKNSAAIGAGISGLADVTGAFASGASGANKGSAIGGALGGAADAAFFGGLPIASTVGKTLGSIIGGGSDRKKQAISDQKEREAMMRDTSVVDLSDDERYGYSPYMEEGGLVYDDKDPKKNKQNTSITTKRGNVITDEDLEKNIKATNIPWQSKDQYGEWLDKFAEPIPQKSNSTVTYPYGKRGETMTQDEWDYVRKKRGYPDVYSDKKQGTDNFIPGESFSNEVRNSIKEYRSLQNTAKMEEGGKVKPATKRDLSVYTPLSGNVENYSNSYNDTFKANQHFKDARELEYNMNLVGRNLTAGLISGNVNKVQYDIDAGSKAAYEDILNNFHSNQKNKGVISNKTGKYEDGGEVMDYSQEASYQPVEVNIEKGELLTDQEGNIIREFNNPNRFAPHNKNSFKESSGNFVELPEGAIVIPKKDAKVFKQGDSITKKSILRNILQNQAETPTPNVRDEEVYMADGGKIPYKDAMNPEYIFNMDNIINQARGKTDYTTLPNGSIKQIPINLPEVTGDLSYRIPDNTETSNIPSGQTDNKANLGYYLHEAAPYLAQASNIALANKPDTYLSPEYNNRADEAYQYLNNMDTDYDISLGLSRNESALGTALRGQRDRNTPASGVVASEMLGRTLSGNNELADTKNKAELQMRNNKAGALSQFVNQRGEGERAENIRYQTEQRMNEGSRRSEMSGAINNIAEITQQQVNSREKIKALNSMTEFHDLDPSKQKLITDDPQARDRILKLVNTGYSPQMAFKMVLGADLASADNVKRTTTEKTNNGSVRTTTSN